MIAIVEGNVDVGALRMSADDRELALPFVAVSDLSVTMDSYT